MFLAEVLGTVVSPVQHPVLGGEKLLLLRVLRPDGTSTVPAPSSPSSAVSAVVSASIVGVLISP